MALNDIELISFDVDETLIDFRATERKALTRVSRLLAKQWGIAAPPEHLAEVRNRLARDPGLCDVPLLRLRKLSFEKVLKENRIKSRDAIAQAMDAYKKIRFGGISFFPDTRPVIEKLYGKYRLALLTNGNTTFEQTSLAASFSFFLSKEALGFGKPSPAFFKELCRRAVLNPEQIMHVGDSLAEDVAGAKQAGLISVWLNRHNEPNESGIRPHYQIDSLWKLSRLLLDDFQPGPA